MKTPEFFDCSEAMAGAQLAGDFVLSALIMGRRPETATGQGLWIKAVQTSIEGEIKVIASLFTVSNDVQSRAELIVDRSNHGIGPKLLKIRFAEFF